MKKNKLFVFLSLVTAVLIFGVAATCNLCGTPIQIGETTDAIDEVDEEESSGSTGDGSQATATEEQQDGQTGDTGQEITEETDQSESVEEIDSEDDQEVPEEEGMEVSQEPTIVTLNPVVGETGCVSADRSQVVTFYILVGHSEDGKHYRGYVSFDISNLSTENVVDFAELKLLNPQIFEPRALLRDLVIRHIDYGAGPLNSSVVGITSSKIIDLPNTTANINVSNENLINALQSCIEDGKDRFQITLLWSSPEAYVDFATHGNVYLKEDISLLVTYF